NSGRFKETIGDIELLVLHQQLGKDFSVGPSAPARADSSPAARYSVAHRFMHRFSAWSQNLPSPQWSSCEHSEHECPLQYGLDGSAFMQASSPKQSIPGSTAFVWQIDSQSQSQNRF
ncbi:MAG TPA: hypothetical protein VEB19_10545, partial [Gemmatimonadaceae bacterium]|nr:hypothetical protein [Gemmatimonadaceae bacterium]